MSKKVFISYSWDSTEHKEWVVSLANTLRSVYGIEAIIDDFLVVANLNKMMVQSITENDKVIVVVTSKYTEKANNFSGGVGYETELLLNYIRTNPNKIIVVLKDNCEKPFYLEGYYHIDFTQEEILSSAINELVLRIKDQPNYEMLEVNTDNPKEVHPNSVGTFSIDGTREEDLVSDIERLLSVTGHSFSPTGKIACANWIREFGYEIVVESVKIAISQYLVPNDKESFTKESIHMVFNKIGGICKNKYNEKTKPYIAGTKRIINYCKKKFNVSYYKEQDLNSILGTLLYKYYKCGTYDEKMEDLLQFARTSRTLNDFIDIISDME